MTFSIIGRCTDTGQLGIAISSSSIAVGAREPSLIYLDRGYRTL